MKKENFSSKDLVGYEKHYSEGALWTKIGRFAGKAGVRVVYYALVLYYTLVDPATPQRYKAVIMGALGYLILPADILADFLPVVGLVDDWGALLAAVAYVMTAITPENKEKARAKLQAWFPNYQNSDLGDLA